MFYSIFRNNALVVRVRPDDNSELSQQKQTEDLIRLNFTLEEYIDFKIGDYIVFAKNSQRYYLNKKPRTVESPKNYRYECIFEGAIHALQNTKILLTTPKTGGGNYTDYRFPLTGNARTFLQFIVDNLNRNGGNFIAGEYTDTKTITVDFNNWNAFEAITVLAEQLSFAWYLQGNTLHFKEMAINTGYIFRVGRGSGFTDLTRMRVESKNIITVLYGFGGIKNLPPRSVDEGVEYDSQCLTENRLYFDGEDGQSKLSNNVDKYGIIEDIKEFDDIVPEFTGTVQVLNSNLNEFYDTTVLFDINEYLLPGIQPKITFLTGKLIGMTFPISFDATTKKITMDLFTDESGQYPNAVICLTVGDQYKLFDIGFPEAYIIDASDRLRAATQSYLNDNSKPQELYEGSVDEEYLRSHNIILNIGDVIRIISGAFGIDNGYEIKALTQSITNPYVYKITFGDVLPKSLLSLLKISQFKTDQNIQNIKNESITNNDITNNIGEAIAWEQL